LLRSVQRGGGRIPRRQTAKFAYVRDSIKQGNTDGKESQGEKK